MLMKELVKYIESYMPTHLAEKYDNVGLLVGDLEAEVNSVYLCLDPTMEVIEDAIRKGVDMILSHHPYGLDAFKKVTTSTNEGRKIIKLIQNNIGLYAAHTNLDRSIDTINEILFNRLELINSELLIKNYREYLYKLVVFVPNGHVDYMREVLGDAGAGHIGHYSHCAFVQSGQGMFKPLPGADPTMGTIGELAYVDEVKVEVVVEGRKLDSVILAMRKAHPYEEVAYDVFESLVEIHEKGYGLIGYLKKPMTLSAFIEITKIKLELSHLQYVGDLESIIHKVVICSGSGMSFLEDVIATNADVFITGDIKYHDAIAAKDQQINLIDASHYGTEKYVIEVFKDLLSTLDITLIIDQVSDNPIQVH